MIPAISNETDKKFKILPLAILASHTLINISDTPLKLAGLIKKFPLSGIVEEQKQE